jgi:uncharacterized protein (DUF934 family)
MPVIKGTQFGDDSWVTIGKDDPLPETGDVILSLPRFIAEPQLIDTHQGKLGIAIANNDRIEALTPYLKRIALIVLPFPAFSDGRAYSQARQLREQGYRGELRAAGEVLPDQLQFMLQVGFDSFQVSDRFPQEAWLKASRTMSLAYQRGLVRPAGQAEVWTERHSGPGPLAGQPKAG